MIVNLNSEMTGEEIGEIEDHFRANRVQYGAMHIVAPYDREHSTWTNKLEGQVLHRITALASAASTLLQTQVTISDSTVQQLFRPSLNDYDLVIQLNRDQVPRHHENADSHVRVSPPTCHENVNHKSLPVVDFNPAQRLLDELKAAFFNIALFFYDGHGGLSIGVVWKPKKLEAQPLKILNAAYKCSLPSESGKMMNVISFSTSLLSFAEPHGLSYCGRQYSGNRLRHIHHRQGCCDRCRHQ